MKQRRSVLTLLSCLAFAGIMVVAQTDSADAHRLGFSHSHGGGVTLGIGKNGVFGGLILGGRHGRRSHCHGSSFCHRHGNRGYHNHNRRGVVIYPRNTAPNYGNVPGSAHVNWCLNRYRSYDIYTDTFQPYKGRRKRCNSPYD